MQYVSNLFRISNVLELKQMQKISIKHYLINFMIDKSDNRTGEFSRGLVYKNEHIHVPGRKQISYKRKIMSKL